VGWVNGEGIEARKPEGSRNTRFFCKKCGDYIGEDATTPLGIIALPTHVAKGEVSTPCLFFGVCSISSMTRSDLIVSAFLVHGIQREPFWHCRSMTATSPTTISSMPTVSPTPTTPSPNGRHCQTASAWYVVVVGAGNWNIVCRAPVVPVFCRTAN
jgi:hypothetical protein